MDEVSINGYGNPKTIDVIGRKRIPIKTSNSENMRVSILFSCLSTGVKLDPLIFLAKGKEPGKNLRKNLDAKISKICFTEYDFSNYKITSG